MFNFSKSRVSGKNVILSLIFIFCSFAQVGELSAANTPFVIPFQQLNLKAGTIVSLQLNEEVDIEEMQVGNTLDFLVRSDVRVNGKVVIATGTIAEGWVKRIWTSCEGRCTKITITVENVQTVDGQRIYLRSIPHTVQVNCCDDNNYQPAVIPLGTKVSARVLNNVNIEV